MKSLIAHGTWLLLALSLVLVPRPAAEAADYFSSDFQPVARISVASVGDVLSDVEWITQAAGAQQQQQLIQIMAMSFTQGIDPEEALGLVVGTDGQQFTPLGFVPVSDLETLFDMLQQQTDQRPEEVEDGLYAYEGPQATVYIREENGHAFFSVNPDALSDLPSDPADLLGELPEDYTLAAQVYVQNIPEEMRQMAIEQMRMGMEMALRKQPGENDEAFELRQTVVRRQIQQLADLVDQAEELTIGLAVDSETASTYLDLTLTTVEGSKTARQFEAVGAVTTDHSGFLLPDAAVTMNISSQLVEEDIDQALLTLEQAEANALSELEEAEDVPDEETRQLARELISGLFDVLEETIQEGKLDGGAALILEPGAFTLAAGGHVSSGADLEEQFNKMLDISEQDPNFPGIERDVLDYKGVHFHSVVVPMDGDPVAEEVIGEEMEVLVGFGDESFYVVLGKDCTEIAKAVLDGSAAGAGTDLPPLQLNVALAPILRFAATVGGDPLVEEAAAALEDAGGNDLISLRGMPIERGVNYRLELQEGVFMAVGAAVMSGAVPAGEEAGPPAF